MYDGGIDAESLSSTIDYLLHESSSNGICPIQGGPIDLDLPFHKTGNDTLMEGFDPQIREESSDEEASTYDVTRSIKQALGDYSNASIEERVNTNERTSKESTKSATEKAEIKKQYDLLRESANRMSLQTNHQDVSVKTSKDEPKQDNASASQDSISTEAPQEDRMQDNKEVPNQRHNQKSRKKRYKYKNAAINSLLGISNASTVQPAEQVNASSSTFVKPAVVNGVKPAIVNDAKPPGRGRGRHYDNSRRNNISMIRPECIIGYDSNPDYNPNYPLGNSRSTGEEFPPL